MALKIRKDGSWVELIPPTPDIPEATSSVSAVAEGTITANYPVILTDAGTAKAITTVGESQASSPSTFLTGDANNSIYNVQSATWDTNQNVVIITWAVDSTTNSQDQDLKIQAGTISGTSVTWGTSSFTNSPDNTGSSSVASNGKGGGLLTYKKSGNMKGKTFTVSGTTITLGSEFGITVYSNGGAIYDGSVDKITMSYLGEDGGSDYFVACYDRMSTGYSSLRIIKIDSSYNATVGDRFDFTDQNDGSNFNIVAISSNKFVIFWDNDNAVVCIRSGTDVFLGERANIGGQAATIISGAYDSINDKLVFASAAGVVKVCTVSGSNISLFFESRFQLASETGSTTGNYPKVAVTEKGQILVSYQTVTTVSGNNLNLGYQIIGTWNDTRDIIIWGTNLNWRSQDDVQWVQLVNADDGKIVTVYAEKSTANGDQSGKSWVTQTATTTLTKDNFFGFVKNTTTGGNTAIINVIGKTTTNAAAASGLTINEKYFVQDDGTIGIGRSSFGVLAGKALSSTSLLITPDYYDTVQSSSSSGGGGGGSSGGTTTTPIVVTSNTTAASNQLIIVNDSSLTITLPASPDVADIVEVRILGTRYCTIARNGSKIESLEENLYIDTMDGYVRLIYTSATLGWIISS